MKMGANRKQKHQAVLVYTRPGDIMREVAFRTEHLSPKFQFCCSRELEELLLSGTSDKSNTPIRRLEEILRSGGIQDLRIVVTEERNPVFTITVNQYYTGFRLVRAIEKTASVQLTPLDRQTLAAAWKCLEGIHGTDVTGTIKSLNFK